MSSTRSEQAINPASAGVREVEPPTTAAADPTTAPADSPAQPAQMSEHPTRRTVRLDAEYLDAGRKQPPAPLEPDDEQLIVLPRRRDLRVLRVLHRLIRR